MIYHKSNKHADKFYVMLKDEMGKHNWSQSPAGIGPWLTRFVAHGYQHAEHPAGMTPRL